MLSCDRRTLLAGAIAGFGLAGCGFTPVYGPGGGAGRFLNAVEIDEPGDRDAFLLAVQLRDRLGVAQSPRYALSYALETSSDGIAVTRGQEITRFNLLGEATWALRDLVTGAVVGSGKTQTFTGYSTTGSTVATQAARRDARARLMVMLADQIVVQMISGAA